MDTKGWYITSKFRRARNGRVKLIKPQGLLHSILKFVFAFRQWNFNIAKMSEQRDAVS
jgi:hypothetical protein